MLSSTNSSPSPQSAAVSDKTRHFAEPPPADFGDWVAIETVPQLAARYDRSLSTIFGWRKAVGFVGRSGFDVAATGLRRQLQPPPSVTGDDTPVRRAAQWLRKAAKIGNVFPCSILLREQSAQTWGDKYNWVRRATPQHQIADHGIGWYMVDGHGVMPEESMVELARKHGFGE